MNCGLPIADFGLPVERQNGVSFSGSIANRKSSITHGFTLIELMMVVAIIGLLMATGVPAILSVTREAPMRKAVNDVTEICSRARSQAILQEQTMT